MTRSTRGMSMHRAVLVMASVVAALLVGTPGLAADNGLTVLAAPPVSQGQMRLQVEVTQPALQQQLRKAGASPERFRVTVKQEGARAQVTAVQRLADSSEGRYTVLAFDQSKSFAPYWARAFQLAHDYASATGAAAQHHTVAVMTFGKNKDTHCEESTRAGLDACLDKVKKLGTDQLITRLKFYIQEAVREAALKQPLSQGGSREVLVFTDAGEESAALDVKELAREARDKGVRIHTVVFSGTRTTRGLAQRLDEMSQLSEGSGGRNLQVEDIPAPEVPERLRSLATSVENLYWLEVAFCGVKRGQTSDQLSVEALSNSGPVAWSDFIPFRQRDDGGDTAACPSTGAQGSSTGSSTSPSTGVTPQNPQASTGTQTAPPTTPSGTLPGVPASVTERHGPPSWLLALLALLILGVVAVLLLRRRHEPVPAPASTPTVSPPVAAPPAPTPPVTQAEPAPAAPAAWKDPFATLPETRLQVTQGPPGLEPFYRIHKASFTIGARTGEMDLAIQLPQLSGHHVTVQLFKAGNVFIKDENSTNGTFVDGRRLQPGERVQVKPGQSIRLSQQLEFLLVQPGLQPVGETAAGVPLVSAPPTAPVAEAEPARPPRAKDKTLYSPARGDDE